MGRLFGRVEARSTWHELDAHLKRIEGGVDGALRLVPVYAATRLLADQIASAPLKAYRPRPDGAREPLDTQPELLRGRVFAWKFQAMTSLLLHGNAYGLVTARNANQTPTQVVWLPPQRCRAEGDGTTRPAYFLDGRPLPFDDVVHIPAYTLPGQVAGVSPIGAFRVTIETGEVAQQYARDWYDGGGIPAAVVKNTARTISAEEARLLKGRLKATMRNGDPFVTGSDWTYESVGVPAADARFIETMKLTATQVAAIYAVPAEEIGGDTGSSLTYKTLEQDSIKLATRAVRPWAVRLEEAVTDLFAGRTYVRFNLDAGIRADIKTRYEAHEIALRTGLETLPEARALEEKPPLTPAEVADWQKWFGSNPARTGGAENAAQ